MALREIWKHRCCAGTEMRRIYLLHLYGGSAKRSGCSCSLRGTSVLPMSPNELGQSQTLSHTSFFGQMHPRLAKDFEC